jgi:hypothetical protein
MTFFTVVTRGLMRRPVRTGLTIVGIAIGIAAVVALVGISRGFETSWQTGMKSRGTDVVVSNMGSALMPKPFSATVVERIAPLPHVAETCTLLVDLISVEKAEMMIVSARQWGGFSWKNLKIVSGRLPNDDAERAVVLGKTAAEVLVKKVGDTLQLETEELAVVGIVDGGAVVENGSVILSLPLLQEITGEPPAMWAQSIVGFGQYHYRYASGHEGDAPLVSFAPRAQHLVLYLSAGLDDRYPKLLAQLGPHKTGKGCLYLKRLDDADPVSLRRLVERSVVVHRGVDRAST